MRSIIKDTPVRAILLVEDNPADADLVREYLELSGSHYEIHLASRVQQALETMRERDIDIILLDLVLPDATGLETVQTVLTEAEQIPVIVLTGTDDERLATSCIEAGAEDYVRKNDMQPDALRRTIQYTILRHVEAQSRHENILRLVSSIPDAVVVTNQNATICYVNEAAQSLFAQDRHELLGATFPYALYDGQIEAIEVPRENSVRKAEMRVVSIEWEGVPAFLISIRDNTERELLEQKYRQAQKMEALGRLAGGVAHDFNNLLTVLLGSAEMLQEYISDADATELLEDIIKSGERASGLTRQLLAFGKRPQGTPTRLNLNEIVAETERLLHRVIGETIRLHTRFSSEELPIRADPSEVSQIIMNLAINARDAMPRGGKLSIYTERQDLSDEHDAALLRLTPGLHAVLTVTDTGEGMDVATRSRIFEPFFTTKPPEKGTGLGLATVYGFVIHNGGQITVESEPGSGTCFRIYLPFADNPSRTELANVISPDFPHGGETVLLVEDNFVVREVTHRMLTKLGYKVIKASSGNDAWETALEVAGRFDILLTDVMMPGISGFELAERIRLEFPKVALVIMTGYSAEDEPDDEILNHAKLLRKPFDQARLNRALRMAIQPRQSTD